MSNETLEWFEVWEYSDDVGAAFDLSVQRPKQGRRVKSHRESNPDFCTTTRDVTAVLIARGLRDKVSATPMYLGVALTIFGLGLGLPFDLSASTHKTGGCTERKQSQSCTDNCG
jgi:hypothetical protein